MPEIKIANQDTLLNVKSTAEITKTGVETLLNRPVGSGFHFYQEIHDIPRGTFGWQDMGKAPSNFGNASAASWAPPFSAEFDIFLFGAPSARAYKYEPKNHAWTRLPDAPVTLTNSIAVTAGGNFSIPDDIYVLTGGANYANNNRLTKYSPSNNTWTALTNAPVASVDSAAAGVYDAIYVAGGSATGASTQLRKYTPSTDTWITTLAPLPVAAKEAMGWMSGVYFYVLSIENKTLMRYTPSSNSWTNLGNPPFATGTMDRLLRCPFTLWNYYNDYKAIFAGITRLSTEYRGQTWVYNLSNGTWSQLESTLFSSGYAGAGASNYGEFFAFSRNDEGQDVFFRLTERSDIVNGQTLGEVKQSQSIFYKTYGARAVLKLDDVEIPVGEVFVAADDGLLRTNPFTIGDGFLRGWVK